MESNNQAKSSHGGRRPGAGRTPGSANRKTREIADQAAKAGITPLEVMLQAMRTAYRRKGAAAAFQYAKDAAPYIHARIAAVEHSGPKGEAIKVDAAFGLPDPLARVLEQLAGAAEESSASAPVPD